ncbi:hydroxyethylthiazole kinase [Rhizosaccharibacter radicis]|uniref:Hydroxyethylthiazole kinase n=1 Tax=Rhizosaccharibacter radicis TaxID=2782605 RepID=A0ABT1VUF6_9PROT|nr:hydroxyethylthiazole kinase [Acetobacteraceae bacterium KSS12]
MPAPYPSLPAADPDLAGAVADTLDAVRARRPLVHNITNLVVANSTANALLAIGASPAMVMSPEEAGAFARIADSLVINLGTVDAVSAGAMRLAAAAAQEAGTPWVLDPVAVGPLSFRSELALSLLRFRPGAIRGNASEIMALSGLCGAPADGSTGDDGGGDDTGSDDTGGGRGVDSAHGADAARSAAIALARHTGAAVSVSGAVDLVTDGVRTLRIGNGNPLMTRVTGLGCTATALTGACLSTASDTLQAAAHAMVLTGLAGEIAAEEAAGPGSLQVRLLDALHALDRDTLVARARCWWER